MAVPYMIRNGQIHVGPGKLGAWLSEEVGS